MLITLSFSESPKDKDKTEEERKKEFTEELLRELRVRQKQIKITAFRSKNEIKKVEV